MNGPRTAEQACALSAADSLALDVSAIGEFLAGQCEGTSNCQVPHDAFVRIAEASAERRDTETTKWIPVARELIPDFGDWSEPVRVRLEGDTLVLRRCEALSADPGPSAADFLNAFEHLQEVRSQYASIGAAGILGLRVALDPLLVRYEKGERTPELLAEMRGVE